MSEVEVTRKKPRVAEEVEAVKDQLQIQAQVELTVRNGEGGRVAAKWVIQNEAVIEVTKMRVAQTPILHQACSECLMISVQGMMEQHGPAMARTLMALHARVLQGGLIRVVAEEKDAEFDPNREDSRIITP